MELSRTISTWTVVPFNLAPMIEQYLAQHVHYQSNQFIDVALSLQCPTGDRKETNFFQKDEGKGCH